MTIDALLAALAAAPDGYQRCRLLRELARFEGPGVRAALEHYLAHDPAGVVQVSAAELLGERGEREALPALERHARDDDDSLVRAAAQAAAQRLRGEVPQAPPVPLDWSRVTTLREAEQYIDHVGQRRTPEAFASLVHQLQQTPPTLLGILQKGLPNPVPVPISLIRTLARYWGVAAFPTLMERLRTESDSAVRDAIWTALGEYGTVETWPLFAVPDSGDGRAKEAARDRLMERLTVSELHGLLQGERDAFRRCTLAGGLVKKNTNEAWDVILELLAVETDEEVLTNLAYDCRLIPERAAACLRARLASEPEHRALLETALFRLLHPEEDHFMTLE